MVRAQRILALVGALCLGAYLLGLALFHAQAWSLSASTWEGTFAMYLYVPIALFTTAGIGIAIVSAAGVVAIVATMQRRQRARAITLFGMLTLLCAWVCLMLSFPALTHFVVKPPLSGKIVAAADEPLLAAPVAMLTGLLVLICSFFPVQSAGSPEGQTTMG